MFVYTILVLLLKEAWYERHNEQGFEALLKYNGLRFQIINSIWAFIKK